MKTFLTDRAVRASASAKAILIGEHAAVYGFPALAVGLPDIRLHVELPSPQLEKNLPSSWEDAFELSVRGKQENPSYSQRQKLVASFSTCILQNNGEVSLHDFRPQPIRIRSEIPLAAGMGGSAALSTAFVRLVDALRGRESRNVALRANEVDSVFHGVASGLDTAAVAADGNVIEFKKGVEPVSLVHPKTFWLALVDSGTRSQTSDMVAGVAALRRKRPTEIDSILNELGTLTQTTRGKLETGDIQGVGQCLNTSHELLRRLEVSNDRLDKVTKVLRSNGAVGAKLTGAGGGGVVLGIFAADPADKLAEISQYGEVYTTCIAATREEDSASEGRAEANF